MKGTSRVRMIEQEIILVIHGRYYLQNSCKIDVFIMRAIGKKNATADKMTAKPLSKIMFKFRFSVNN